MDIQKLTAFFKWCTIINIVLFIFSVLFLIAAPDFVHGVHGQLFNLSREAFDVIIYSFLGLYKIFILVFNLVPYIALLIIEKNGRQGLATGG